jgi:hypothetical protein
VAAVSARHVADDRGVTEEEFMHLLDHLLGSRAQGSRMSQGYGITPQVETIGQRLQTWYQARRGRYYHSYAVENEREYLAQGVREFIHAPALLQRHDSEMFEFVGRQLLQNDFWEEVLSHGEDPGHH